MTAPVNIWNRALGYLGTQTTISDPNENSPEAHNCGIYYDPVRQSVLRAHTWNFARRQVALTQLGNADDETSLAPWYYKYAYPSDAVFFRYVMPAFTSSVTIPEILWTAQPPVKFQLSGDLDLNQMDIRVVLTNQAEATGVYTRNVEKLDVWDDLAQDALATALAAKLAIALTGDKTLAKAMIDQASGIINVAKAKDGNEGLRIQEHTPDWMRIRGYAADWASPFYGDPLFAIT